MKRLGEIKVGKRLSDDEMKQIVGGDIVCYRWSSGSNTITYFFPIGASSGGAWCDVWVGFGYSCTCRSYNTTSPYIYC